MRFGRLDGETGEYRAARERLRKAEGELIEQRERVAALRRQLPVGGRVDDQAFQEGPPDLEAGDSPVSDVRMSQLFTGPHRSLVVFQLMYGKAQTEPCPMCTMWLDGLNGVARHLAQNVDFVVVAAADLPALRTHARHRGWSNLRLLSAGDNSFKYDMGSEDEDGRQVSSISVFERDADNSIRHTYTSHPQWSDTDHERGLDLLSPVWHVLDITRQGRGDWYPGLSYPSG